MGNSNGAMHWYTEYAYEEPLYQGGFIWDYLDQSVRSKDRYGQRAFNYGGDNGEMPHDGNFCGNGILYGDGEPSEKLQEVKYNYQNIAARSTGRAYGSSTGPCSPTPGNSSAWRRWRGTA